MIKLQSLSIQNCVRLLWNPGHSNIEGNEMADNLAKQAATTNFTGPEPVLGLSVTSVRNTVCQWSVQEQNRKWNDTQNCRQARQLLQNHNIRHAKYAVRLSRRFENLGWPSYWTQFAQLEFKFAEDSRGSYVSSLWRRI